MKIWDVPLKDIEAAAKQLGFRLENVREGGVRKTWVAFTLRMASPCPSKREREKYDDGKLSTIEAKRVAQAMRYRAKGVGRMVWGHGPEYAHGAVCWHGHKRFLEILLNEHPDMRFASKLWRFTGEEDFRRNVGQTGMVNVGSQAFPVQAREACDCYGG